MIDRKLFNHLKAIGDIKTVISGAENLETAIRECVHIIREVSKSESSVIWYYEKDGDGKLHAVYAQGVRTFLNHTIAPGEGKVGEVFQTGKTIFLPDGIDGSDINSYICVPLENSYETLGCIEFINRADKQAFTEEDADVCEIMAMLAAIAGPVTTILVS